MSSQTPISNHPSPTRREWLLAALVALFTIALTLIPYALAYLLPQEGLAFIGTIMNPEDSMTYFAKMFQGYQGAWAYTIPFTTEAHDAAYVGVFYVWLGQLARVTGSSITAVWHISRLIADLILFLVTFGFIAQFLPHRQERWTAYLLALFGSGLGWVLFVVGQPYWLDHFPVDFKQPGAHLFFTAFTFPHITFATACIIVSIWLIWKVGQGEGRLAVDSPRRAIRLVILAGVVNTALGIAYPFLLYLILVITAVYWLYLTLQARRILWQTGFLFVGMFVIPAPLYLYFAYTLQTNAVFKAWDMQAGTPSPPWPHYLVAYGLMLLLGFWHWYKKPEQRSQFAMLWLWVLAVALLVYAPLNPQRRFIQGVHLPLSILTTAAFFHLLLPAWQQSKPFQWLLQRPRYNLAGMTRLTILTFLAFMSISNLYVLASVATSAVIQQPDPIFRPVDELAAVAWLREEGEATVVILIGDYQTGSYAAAHAPVRVMLGHWAETVDYEAKTAIVAQFYNATTSDQWRRDLISQYNIGYVWHGPREQLLGDFDPQTAVYLTPIYHNDTITIYAVR